MMKNKFVMCRGCPYSNVRGLGFACAVYKEPWPTWERRQGQPCPARQAYQRQQGE